MTRRALVIGIEEYRNDAFKSLQHAVEDARRFRDFLRSIPPPNAFKSVEILKNPDDAMIFAHLEAARNGLEKGDLLLIYFAGHGVQQRARSQQLLLCKDARPEVIITDSTNGTIALNTLDEFTSGPYDRVFIFDACRNAYRRSQFRSADIGRAMEGAIHFREVGSTLNASIAPGTTVTIWSCNDGETAAELDEIEAGLFTHTLLEKLSSALAEGSGVRLNEQFMVNVRQSMAERMGIMLDQTPTISCQNGSIELFPPTNYVEEPVPSLSLGRDINQNPEPIKGETLVSQPEEKDKPEITLDSPPRRSLGVAIPLYAVIFLILLALAALEFSGVAILRRVFPLLGLTTPE